MDSLKKIYEFHHLNERQKGFSIMKEERGDFLKKNIGSNKVILDIGCRDGALTKFFVKDNKVLGVDIDSRSLLVARNDLDIEAIEMDLNGDWGVLSNRTFDVIFAGEIIEHLYYPQQVIDKIKKHLNKDGIFLGSVPNAFSIKNRIRYLFANKKNTPLNDPTHISHFSYKDLKEILGHNFYNIEIFGLGRYKKLSKLSPNFFAFDLFFKVSNPR